MNTMGHPHGSVWRWVRGPYLGSSSRRDLQPLPMPYTVRPAVTLRSRFVAAISDSDFVAVAVFCAIGLLATVNLMLHVPNVGIM
jgi:hypothetical protein